MLNQKLEHDQYCVRENNLPKQPQFGERTLPKRTRFHERYVPGIIQHQTALPSVAMSIIDTAVSLFKNPLQY